MFYSISAIDSLTCCVMLKSFHLQHNNIYGKYTALQGAVHNYTSVHVCACIFQIWLVSFNLFEGAMNLKKSLLLEIQSKKSLNTGTVIACRDDGNNCVP